MAGCLGLIAGPKPLQTPETRQKRVARGPGEQGCMYHIWVSKCQIQLRQCQDSNHNDAAIRRPSAQGRIELPEALGRGLCRMQQSDNLLMLQRRLGL
jgi:hypothetical protein